MTWLILLIMFWYRLRKSRQCSLTNYTVRLSSPQMSVNDRTRYCHRFQISMSRQQLLVLTEWLAWEHFENRIRVVWFHSATNWNRLHQLKYEPDTASTWCWITESGADTYLSIQKADKAWAVPISNPAISQVAASRDCGVHDNQYLLLGLYPALLRSFLLYQIRFQIMNHSLAHCSWL